MNQDRIRCTSYAALWLFLLPLVLVSGARAAELTADEILQRSREAMKPPIQYRMITNGVSTVVYQRILSDGVTATRFETSSRVPKISLVFDTTSYEFYPDRGVGIDKTWMHQSKKRQAVARDGVHSGKESAAAEWRDVVLEDGRECFEIIKPFSSNSSNSFAAMRKALPEKLKEKAQEMVPRETRTLIDAKSFVVLETRMVSQAGTTISRSEYRDIQRPADLRDDLFLPPDGMELWKPRGNQEYVGMLNDIYRRRPEEFAVRQPATRTAAKPLMPIPSRIRRPEIDPETGRLIPPSPPGMNREDLDRLVSLSRARAGKLTAREILQRSKEAMKAPIRFRVIRDGDSTDGDSTLVSQIGFFDGTTATRLETGSPASKVSLVLDKISCEFYPDRGMGLDTSSLEQPLASETAAILGVLGGETSSATPVKDFVTDDGRECFQITIPSSNLLPASATAVPQTANETHVLIDKKTFVIVGTQLVSETGSTISRSDYRDIERPVELGIGLFIPPDGIEFYEPQGNQEYVAMLTNILQTQPEKLPVGKKVVGTGRKSSSTRGVRLGETARTASKWPVATIQQEFERGIASRMADGHAAQATASPESGESVRGRGARGWLVAGLLAVVFALTFAIATRKGSDKVTASPVQKRRERGHP